MLGTLRVLWLAPVIGETGAVLAELPAMLAASWFAARRLARRFGISSAGPALAMGALAFMLLMAAELALASVVADGPRGWLDGLMRLPGALGLAGQVCFALMPLLAVRSRS